MTNVSTTSVRQSKESNMAALITCKKSLLHNIDKLSGKSLWKSNMAANPHFSHKKRCGQCGKKSLLFNKIN